MAIYAESLGPSPGCASPQHSEQPAQLVAALVAALEETLLAARRFLVALETDDCPHTDVAAHPRLAPTRLPIERGPACGTRITFANMPALSAAQLPTTGPGAPVGLSRRETQVLRLLAAGQSNREIAATLCLSPRTIQRHVANAYAKIGAHKRAEATTYVHHHRLA